MSHLADQLKEKGNVAFRDGDYKLADELYTQAVQKYSRNPLIFTNSATHRPSATPPHSYTVLIDGQELTSA